MRVWHVVFAAAAAAAITGCGGDGDSAGGSATTAPPTAVSTRASNLGCEVVAQCFPEQARATLERCPASRLDRRGREARRRLERQLARIAGVDLHNEQAYEVSEAAMAALAEFEEECL